MWTVVKFKADYLLVGDHKPQPLGSEGKLLNKLVQDQLSERPVLCVFILIWLAAFGLDETGRTGLCCLCFHVYSSDGCVCVLKKGLTVLYLSVDCLLTMSGKSGLCLWCRWDEGVVFLFCFVCCVHFSTNRLLLNGNVCLTWSPLHEPKMSL